ncbi:CDP-glycerol glycerophosphotransferase family protein [Shewanella sp. 202IG2-18]|nr:CDP-glycerol glycerophosphotransferase family protein [Parashewanella hymeniacidonis]
MNKKNIIYFSFPDVSDNAYHLFKYHNKTLSDYNLIWLVNDTEHSMERLKSRNQYAEFNTVKVVKKNSFYGMYLFLRTPVVFYTHGTYSFVMRTKKRKLINLWHGMPLKKIGYMDDGLTHRVDEPDFILTTSKFYSEIMMKSFNINQKQVLEFGSPRNDVFFQEKYDSRIVKYFNLKKSDSIYFWLPTYRTSNVGDIRADSDSLSFVDDLSFSFSELNEILVQKKVYIIVKPHPMDAFDYSNISVIEQLSNIKFICSSVWEANHFDLHEELSAASGILTDISSILIDLIGTNLNVGVICNQSNYSRGFNSDYSNLIDNLNVNKLSSLECFFNLKRNFSINDIAETTNLKNINLVGSSCKLITSEFL